MAERFRIVPMEPAHYAEAAGTAFPWQDNLVSGGRLIEAGPAFSGFADGQLAAVAGVVCKWPGLGDAWAIVTAVGRQHPVFVHRAVARALRAIVQDRGLRRVTATVVKEWAAARGWVHALGFEKEATMRAYGPKGEDFVQYRMLTVERFTVESPNGEKTGNLREMRTSGSAGPGVVSGLSRDLHAGLAPQVQESESRGEATKQLSGLHENACATGTYDAWAMQDVRGRAGGGAPPGLLESPPRGVDVPALPQVLSPLEGSGHREGEELVVGGHSAPSEAS